MAQQELVPCCPVCLARLTPKGTCPKAGCPRAVADAAPGLAAWLPDEERRRLGLPVDPALPKIVRFRQLDSNAHVADGAVFSSGRVAVFRVDEPECTFGYGSVEAAAKAMEPTTGPLRWILCDATLAPSAPPPPDKLAAEANRQRPGLPVDPALPKRWRFSRGDGGAHIADAVELHNGKAVLLGLQGGSIRFSTIDNALQYLRTAEGDVSGVCLDEAPAPPAEPSHEKLAAETQGEDWAHRVASSLLDGLREHLHKAPSNLSVSAVLAERIAQALRNVREWVPDRVVGELADARTGETTQTFRLRQPGGRVVEVVIVFPAERSP